MRPVLRTVASILEDVTYHLNDTSNSVWSKDVLTRAYNHAIDRVGGSISCRALYTGITDWDGDTYEYSLPAGMEPNTIQPQFRMPVYDLDSDLIITDADDPWTDFASFSVEPDEDGGFKLRFSGSPPSVSARILHSIKPGRIYHATGQFYASSGQAFTDSATTLNVTGSSVGWNIARQGFIYVEQEWIYYGNTRDQSSTTFDLLNLVRGYNGTTAVSHNTPSVYWGIALEHQSDTILLMDAILASCHRMKLSKTASADAQYHQQMVTYYDGRVERGLAARTQMSSPRMVLDHTFLFV